MTRQDSLRQQFIDEARASLAEFQRTSIGYRGEDVHAYFKARAEGRNPPRPKAVKFIGARE